MLDPHALGPSLLPAEPIIVPPMGETSTESKTALQETTILTGVTVLLVNRIHLDFQTTALEVSLSKKTGVIFKASGVKSFIACDKHPSMVDCWSRFCFWRV